MRISNQLIAGVISFGVLFYSCGNPQTESPNLDEKKVPIKDSEVVDQKEVENELTNSQFQDTIYIKIDKNLVATFNNTIIATSFNNEPNSHLITNLLLHYLKDEYSNSKRLPHSILYKSESENASALFSGLDDAISTVQLQMISFIQKEEKISTKKLIEKYPILIQKTFFQE